MSKDFYEHLAFKESSNNHKEINKKTKYIGLYQMGEAALVDTGYYTKQPPEGKSKPVYNNDWTGRWTGKNGINSRDDFLNNRTAQEIAIREYHGKIWNDYLKNFHQYEGQEIGGIKLTKSGMIGCAHLVGHTGIINFIKSNGEQDKKDGNQVTCSNYIRELSDKEIDTSIDSFIAQLQADHPQVQQQQAEAQAQDQAQQQAADGSQHIVQQGDTLSSIASA